MNAKTKEAITWHGLQLLAIFPDAIERDPVALCKKIRRIETAVSRPILDYCNGDCTMEECDAACSKARARVRTLLGIDERHPACMNSVLIINRDPRGYALKIDDSTMRANAWQLYRDMGGYGILAPEINEK